MVRGEGERVYVGRLSQAQRVILTTRMHKKKAEPNERLIVLQALSSYSDETTLYVERSNTNRRAFALRSGSVNRTLPSQSVKTGLVLPFSIIIVRGRKIKRCG